MQRHSYCTWWRCFTRQKHGDGVETQPPPLMCLLPSKLLLSFLDEKILPVFTSEGLKDNDEQKHIVLFIH